MKIKLLTLIALITFLIGCENDNTSNEIDMQLHNLNVSMSMMEASNLGLNITNATATLTIGTNNISKEFDITGAVASASFNSIVSGVHSLQVKVYQSESLIADGTTLIEIKNEGNSYANLNLNFKSDNLVIDFDSDLASVIVENYSLLSTSGSSRATAYPGSNKFTQINDKLYTTFLDFTDGHHTIKLTEIDANSGNIEQTVAVGIGRDNHAGAAILSDHQDNIHIFYGAHADYLKYRRTKWSSDIKSLSEESNIIFGLTYPSAVYLGTNEILLAARYGTNIRASEPWSLNVYTISEETVTSSKRLFLSNQQDGQFSSRYTHYYHKLSVSKNGRIHLAFVVHERPLNMPEGLSGIGVGYGVVYMYSDDNGVTWYDTTQRLLELPTNINEVSLVDGVKRTDDVKHYFQTVAIAVSPSTNDVYLVYPTYNIESKLWELWLAKKDASSDLWEKSKVGDGYYQSNLTITEHGELFILSEAGLIDENPIEAWSSEQKEIKLLYSKDDGDSFVSYVVSDSQNNTLDWLPNLQRTTSNTPLSFPIHYMYTSGTTDNSKVHFGVIKK